MTDRPDIPYGYTYDKHGNELTYRDRGGYWREGTYDAHHHLLTLRMNWSVHNDYTNATFLTRSDSTATPSLDTGDTL